MVPLKDKVVVSLGSDPSLLDQTLANLAASKPGLAKDPANSVFRRALHAKRGGEFHLSPTCFLNMEAGKRIKPPNNEAAKQDVDYKQVSIGITLQPRFLGIEWRIPEGEVRAVWKHFWF
jgi:hypothetical protein